MSDITIKHCNSLRFDLKTNYCNEEEIKKLILSLDEESVKTLQNKIEINSYVKKIRKKAMTIEVWLDNNLVGIIACYVNSETKTNAYITYFCVHPKVQGLGLAKKMYHFLLRKDELSRFKSIFLKVDKDNLKALTLYKSLGFIQTEEEASQYTMEYPIKDFGSNTRK